MDHNQLTSTCMNLAWLCAVAAAVSTLASWWLRPKDTADVAVAAANKLAVHPNLLPSAGDVSKVIDASKGLIDSLSKASPLAAWLAASVFFTAIAAFNVSDYSHKDAPPPPIIKKNQDNPPQSHTPAPKPK